MNAREVADRARTNLVELADRLGSRRAAVDALSGSGLSPSWIRKFLNGEISNPTVDSLATLEAAMETQKTKAAA